MLEFGASIFFGKEAEIAAGERLIRREKHAEFLDNGDETFGKQAGSNQAGGHGVGAVIRDHTQIQILNVVLGDVVEESGEVGE